MGIIDFEALKVWNRVPDDAKPKILANAFCPSCLITSFAPGYSMRMEGPMLLIEGVCDKCGRSICRVVEEP